MDKLYTWALALILVGVILMAFGIVTRIQRKMLEGDLERFDAVVTKLKPVTRRYNYGDAVTLYAEYTVNGKLTEGYFYTSLPSKMFPYRPGGLHRHQGRPHALNGVHDRGYGERSRA
ncbi:hypothetical protein [Ruminococcus sp.]|uniref:hypothetical protein n=1 Tax=Ruminococcus sp. TaxID=41978 RepID=UPI002C062AF4|nr:hypothetical protein [Ruminococcus sp.]HOA00257.1 hypothetical protein [Ruminococcus sp.]HOH86118.1 hypothetical protein [Ruminococcus sp.]